MKHDEVKKHLKTILKNRENMNKNKKNQWQTMATAPKDCQQVLLYDGNSYEIGFYLKDDGFYEGRWLSTRGRNTIFPYFWQPLPEKPSDFLYKDL